MSLLMLMSAGMYFFNHEEIAAVFTGLGYPTYIIYPLAIAKILALVAIWTNLSIALKEWAYAGLFFDFVLAFSAHVMISDGNQMAAVLAMVLLSASYYSWKKLGSVGNK